MPGYWMVRASASRDDEAAAQYGQLWGAIAEKYGAKVIAGKGESDTVEGPTYPRNLIVEFPSYAAAHECYHSDDYAPLLALALMAFERELVILEG